MKLWFFYFWSFYFSIKPLRDLQSNSPFLVLTMNTIGARLGEHLQITLLGNILFVLLGRPHCALLQLRHKLRQSHLLPVCALISSPTLCSAAFDKVQVWVWVNKAAPHSGIFPVVLAAFYIKISQILHFFHDVWDCFWPSRQSTGGGRGQEHHSHTRDGSNSK